MNVMCDEMEFIQNPARLGFLDKLCKLTKSLTALRRQHQFVTLTQVRFHR